MSSCRYSPPSSTGGTPVSRVCRLWFGVVAIAVMLMNQNSSASVEVALDPAASPRVQYGAARLTDALKSVGASDGRRIALAASHDARLGREGFRIATSSDGAITITGGDDSGLLYGCIELARRVREARALPRDLNLTDAPAWPLRGPCIGMQKTFILPGRKVYEYPYTPELFPFFYDKQHWTEYLDFLAEHRMNTLYLWSGHPFASLVRLPDYPYAREVPDDVFARNVEMFRWIASEADRRGIWVVQMFYSIILSKPFAERHGLDTQLRESTPLVDDYMRKSIAEFVVQYPNVGLMICLGEALQGQENQNRFLTDVCLAGIKDGMRRAGMVEEPPVVIRTHATDLTQAMPHALRVYKNIYTEAKFNGESLTTHEPRGVRQQVHLAMSRLGSTHMINVHILANLEPFRYGAQRFIKRSVQAGRDRLGARGLHLYPLFYWNWPDAPDKLDPPLKQIDRDWIWFEAWARYAWNPDVPEAEDRAYWVTRLAEMYGSREAAERILDAYNDAGECAPRILRRFGITEGNRQTMSLGMTLDQLVEPERYRPFPELWESQSPPGERLEEYAQREWRGEPHEGETPPQIVAEVLDYSMRAADAIEAAAPHVTTNRDEFERVRNDVHCIRAMSQCYAAKVNAAMLVLRYRHSKDVNDLVKAEPHLAESLEHFRKLAALTKDTYRFANSMQTNQRKIPVNGGVDGKPVAYHWVQLVPLYENELDEFRHRIELIKSGKLTAVDESTIRPLPKASFKVLSEGVETYGVDVGTQVFRDWPITIRSIAPELRGLQGVRISHEQAKAGRYVPIEFETTEPVRVLIGYVKSKDKAWLQPPDLETDANAVEQGGVEPILLNALTVESLPPVDVYALDYGAGRHKLELRGSGSFLILGLIPRSARLEPRDAHRAGGAK